MTTRAMDIRQEGLGIEAALAKQALPYSSAEAIHALRLAGYRFPEAVATMQPVATAALTLGLLGGARRIEGDGLLSLFARLLRAVASATDDLSEAVAELIALSALDPDEARAVAAEYRRVGQTGLAAAVERAATKGAA